MSPAVEHSADPQRSSSSERSRSRPRTADDSLKHASIGHDRVCESSAGSHRGAAAQRGYYHVVGSWHRGEAGTYIRGTAQLTNGEAIVNLPEHFSLVTNENGLTVQLTCLDECNGLRIIQKGTKQIIVRELLGGQSNARFDYLVQGVRKGYEHHQVIQEKK